MSAVDSYRFLPRRLAEMIRAWPAARLEPVPFTALRRPLRESTLALVTTAGIHAPGDAPFDSEREQREPAWGDPTYREIPRDVPRQGIGTSHLHVNNEFVARDLNVCLPLDHAEEAVADGLVAAVAPTHYSFMGFQLDTGVWERESGPQAASAMRRDGVDVALLTPV